MGDDIPDLKVMKMVGLPTCPADAVPEIKAISKYISPYTGGQTAVRDVIEKVLRVQENWFDEHPSAADSGK
ncbi:3-deoxy-D-manno-octulosonate 8-phosphate phosphatase [compost metagenome]